jgi:chromosome segregation ATPase
MIPLPVRASPVISPNTNMSIFLTQELYNSQNGQALLTLENPEEPYLAGVRYSVQVPGKICVAMDCLSGAEAALASLAFMFALNRCCMQPRSVI